MRNEQMDNVLEQVIKEDPEAAEAHEEVCRSIGEMASQHLSLNELWIHPGHMQARLIEQAWVSRMMAVCTGIAAPDRPDWHTLLFTL